MRTALPVHPVALAALLLVAVAGCGQAATPAATPTQPPPPGAVATPPVADPTSIPEDSAGAAGLVVEDGEPWIALQWLFDGSDGVQLMRPDGSDRQPILASLGNTFHPDWSHDGLRLAFEVGSADTSTDIWTSRPDGGDLQLLVDHAACPGDCRYVLYPAWSPDDASIAFIRFRFDGDELVASTLEVVPAAGGDARVVYTAPARTALNYPRWSPDGASIVFEFTTYPTDTPESGAGTGSAIAVIDATAAGAKPRVLTEPSVFASYPDWHPSDDLIVFTTYDLGEYQATDEPSNLYTIRPDGSDLRAVTTFGPADQRATQPTWTPDGDQIMFTLVGQADGFDGPRQVATIAPDGSDQVTPGPEGTHARLRPTP